MPKEEKKVPTYLTAEDVQRLLRAIEADYEIKAAQGQAQPGEILWLRDVTTFAVSTGLRREEICSLRWSGVRPFQENNHPFWCGSVGGWEDLFFSPTRPYIGKGHLFSWNVPILSE